MIVDAGGTRMTLRVAPDHASPGFEVKLWADASRATIARLSPGAGSPEPHDTVQPEDVDKIRALRDDMVVRANALLAEHKYSLIAARLDDTPLQKLDMPRLLAERLIAHIAPTVEEISTRSPVAGELAIKRQLSNSHREENFVSKWELWKRIEPLPDALRHLFDPLKLWGIGRSRARRRAARSTRIDRALQRRRPRRRSSKGGAAARRDAEVASALAARAVGAGRDRKPEGCQGSSACLLEPHS